MKTFKCVVVRSQYQTITIKAKNFADAKDKARFMFDPDKEYNQYVETYECNEVPTKEKENV